MAKKQNVQKRKARPKRSIAKPGDDHELGLWIDKDLLCKHQNRYRQTIIHDPLTSTKNLYLELADIALGNNKPKKKLKKYAASASQSEGGVPLTRRMM
jgi:hypothetical protein